MMTWHYAVGIQTEYFCAIYGRNNIFLTIITQRFEKEPIVELKYNFCSLPGGCLMMKLSRQNFVIKHFLGKRQKNKLKRSGAERNLKICLNILWSLCRYLKQFVKLIYFQNGSYNTVKQIWDLICLEGRFHITCTRLLNVNTPI